MNPEPLKNQTTIHSQGSAELLDRRKKPDGEKTSWTVTECWDLHAAIKRRIFIGQKNTVIARELGCDKQTVSNVRNSPLVKAQLAELHEQADKAVVDVRAEINRRAPEALQTLEELMRDAENENVRAKCAVDILDRAGFKAPSEVHVKGMIAHLTGEDIMELQERALAASRAAGLIVEVSPNDDCG